MFGWNYSFLQAKMNIGLFHSACIGPFDPAVFGPNNPAVFGLFHPTLTAIVGADFYVRNGTVGNTLADGIERE